MVFVDSFNPYAISKINFYVRSPWIIRKPKGLSTHEKAVLLSRSAGSHCRKRKSVTGPRKATAAA